MLKAFVEEKFKELITNGVLELQFDEFDDEYCVWALEYYNGKFFSDSGQCHPDILTKEQAKQVISDILGAGAALEEIESLGWSVEEDGICKGTEDNSVYYACDHDAENIYYKTTYGNMCNGVIEEDEIQMTAQEVLNDILAN